MYLVIFYFNLNSVRHWARVGSAGESVPYNTMLHQHRGLSSFLRLRLSLLTMGSTLGLGAQHYRGVGCHCGLVGCASFTKGYLFIHQELRMFIIDIYKSRPLKRNCHNGNIDSLEVIYMKYLPRVKDGQGYFFIFSWILRRLGIQLRGKQLWCISHSNCLVNIINTILKKIF